MSMSAPLNAPAASAKRRSLTLAVFLASIGVFLAIVLPRVTLAYGEGGYYAEGYYQGYYEGAYSGGSGGALATQSKIFIYTGSTQTFVVPNGVTSVRVALIGGGGGGGGGAIGWGSGAGGGCGGGIAGGTIPVTPGASISVTVGAGGAGGGDAANGSTGGVSAFGSLTAVGGSWGRNGYYNLWGQYSGGSGGGSGSGGGGNAWPGYQGVPGRGGTEGSQTNSYGSGGYCTGSGWNVDLTPLITSIPYSPGAGGYAPGGYVYYGGGGGGGLVLNGSIVSGKPGNGDPSNAGAGYGGGGGGSYYTGPGGSGAPGAIYVEWDAIPPTCSISFDSNPIAYGGGTTLYWSSQNAYDSFYINNVGYVTPDVSGSAWVQPAHSTDYSGTVVSTGGTATCSASSGTPSGTLDVTPPPSPTVTISASSTPL